MRFSLTALSLALMMVMSTTFSQTAPLPRKGGLELEKYLLDDTDFVFIINVKNIVESPAFTKHYKILANMILTRPEVKPFLEGSGIDPLKDIERVVIYMGRSCWGEDGRSTGPMFLIQGKFNATKLHAKAAELSKKFAGKININKVGASTIYEMKGFPPGEDSSYATLLDSHTIYWGVGKEKLDQTLARAQGKKKTNLKSKQLAKLLKDLDPKAAVESLASSTMVYSASYRFRKGDERPMRTLHTLDQVGIHQVHGLATIKDKIRGRIVFRGNDAAGNDRVSRLVLRGVEEMKKELPRMRKRRLPNGVPMEVAEHFFTAIESVTAQAGKKGATVTFQGHPRAALFFPMVIIAETMPGAGPGGAAIPGTKEPATRNVDQGEAKSKRKP